MTKKELIDLIKNCDDNCNVYVEYQGWGIELDNGDSFKITDIECTGNVINLEIG